MTLSSSAAAPAEYLRGNQFASNGYFYRTARERCQCGSWQLACMTPGCPVRARLSADASKINITRGEHNHKKDDKFYVVAKPSDGHFKVKSL